MYIRTVTTASGATAVQIMEKKRGQRVVVDHVGSAWSDEEVAVLKATARARIHAGQQVLDLGIEEQVAVEDTRGSGGNVSEQDALFEPGPPAAGPQTRSAPSPRVLQTASMVLFDVLQQAYRALGFDAVGDEVFEKVVLARIVKPTSKLAVGSVLADLGQQGPHHTTIYRHMKKARTLEYRDTITTACFRYARAAGDVSLVLYDVTTLYFEAEKEDELRKVGYSKERRVDPQVLVGLLVDRTGFPLEIGCFEGNQAETFTLLPMIRQFQTRHQLADMVVVADAGMLSEANLKALDEAQLKFIVGSRQAKAPGDLATHFHWNGDAFTDGQIIDTITPRRATKESKKPRTVRAEPIWNKDQHQDAWRAIWQYSRKRALRDRRTLTMQENRAKAVVAGDKPTHKPRFVKDTASGLQLDEASLARAHSLVGLKGYVTNIPANIMPGEEVISSYHDLWHVEDSFRMAKSDLRARPMFHHQRDAIEAHLTIAFTSLAVSRYLRARTGLSINRIVRTLQPLRSATLDINGSTHLIPPEITDDARTIIDTIRPDPGH